MRLPERARLAQLPTPIHPLPRLSRELGKQLYAWRDDLTGFAESGNKVRKLDFLAAEALAQGADNLVTCGGPQSNHARATAVVARRLGLGISILMRKPQAGLDPSAKLQANYLLDRMLGADIELIEFADYAAKGSKYDAFLADKAERLRRQGRKPFVIPEGGSCATGCFGYLAAIGEMLTTWKQACPERPAPDAVFAAIGSGGTYAGLHLGLEANGLSASLLHGVSVCDDKAYFEKRIHGLFDDVERQYHVAARSRAVQIHDGYKGLGYAVATDDELRFYVDVARSEGLLLDPCYTGKAFRGMVQEIRKDPSRFGSHVLFLHSGGGFGNFAYSAQYDRVLGN